MSVELHSDNVELPRRTLSQPPPPQPIFPPSSLGHLAEKNVNLLIVLCRCLVVAVCDSLTV